MAQQILYFDFRNSDLLNRFCFYCYFFQSDIVDVNTIFKELATMVHEQGEMIDSIEANVESSQMRVEEGTSQLATASSYQVVFVIPVMTSLSVIH